MENRKYQIFEPKYESIPFIVSFLFFSYLKLTDKIGYIGWDLLIFIHVVFYALVMVATYYNDKIVNK